ncbi:hypothetical protein BT93_F1519 [Corymbia citriodora subsp. variegata]|nr:hypothetical protein BT93_F1519 [Corymbia citriodora subsp. variegata]
MHMHFIEPLIVQTSKQIPSKNKKLISMSKAQQLQSSKIHFRLINHLVLE